MLRSAVGVNTIGVEVPLLRDDWSFESGSRFEFSGHVSMCGPTMVLG